ncbi:MAG: site-specific integrase [Planctomycetes bacterium]|nr:site-specific integrase [Planctomycetota bacterium]
MRKRRKVFKYLEDGRPFWRLGFIDPKSGKLRRESAGTADEAEAEILRQEKEADLNNGRYVPPNETSWQEFMDAYSEEQLPKLKPRTREKRSQLLALFEELIEPKSMGDVTARALSRFSSLRGQHCSLATVKSDLAHLRSAFRWAVDQGMLREVPKTETVKVPKGTNRRRIRIAARITLEHFERLLMKAGDPWMELLIAFCWHCGMRRGEAMGVCGEHIDLDAHRIAIPNNKAGDEGATAIIPPELDAMLRERYPDGIPAGRLIPMDDDRALSERFGRRIARKAAVKGNGLGGYCTLHDLRRNFGSRWAGKVPAQVLQRLMRHANIRTTMEFYADVEQSIVEMFWPQEAGAKRQVSQKLSHQRVSAGSDGIDSEATHCQNTA